MTTDIDKGVVIARMTDMDGDVYEWDGVRWWGDDGSLCGLLESVTEAWKPNAPHCPLEDYLDEVCDAMEFDSYVVC